MKLGTAFPVSIDGHVVSEAIVEDIYEDQVTLVIPTTRVVMQVNTSLAGKAAPDTDRILGSQPAPDETPSVNPDEVSVSQPSLKDAVLDDDID